MPGCIIDTSPGDSFEALLDQLLADHASALPNLSHIQVLLPELNHARQFRAQLLAKSKHEALIPPRLNTLRGWVEEQIPPSARLLNTHARELMLVETLQELEPFGSGHNPWNLADSLLRLFDELQLSQLTVSNLDDLFSSENPVVNELSHFSEAAQKITLLWDYFQSQQKAENATDRVALYRQGLEQLTSQITEITSPIYLTGISWLQARELQLVQSLLEADKLTLFFRQEQPLAEQLKQLSIDCEHRQTANDTKKQFLDAVYNDTDRMLKQRAAAIRKDIPQSPVKSTLQIFAASSEEQEARAIDLQTRYWLHTGRKNIGIITEDRRLARRVSALLENAGLTVQDAAGWPLSTTTAAGVFDRWLSSIENDFFYLSLLDVLKSGFLADSINLDAVYHFEKDIIEREGIARDCEQYKNSINERASRLDFADDQYSAEMLQMLQRIETAAAPVLEYLNKRHHPELLLDALGKSLQLLGLESAFENDAAGQRILQELIDLRQSLHGRSITMHWNEFRQWLQRALETHNFRPAISDGLLDLINLGQSNTGKYDALIIAGATLQHLPGKQGSSDFFNNNVRRELGLKNRDVHRAERFSQFRRILHAADEILISYTATRDDEPSLPSPWVEILTSFHQQAYGDNLAAHQLSAWLDSPEAELQSEDAVELPAVTTRPAPTLPDALLPRRISASAHQTLIDCPYRFFAAKGLSLKPREAIVEQLSKRDYGTMVHESLQRYHSTVSSSKKIGREQAITQLANISREVFSDILEADFLDQSWWLTWETLIPYYIDWQLKREENWQVSKTEFSVQKNLDIAGFRLEGRIDRVDQNQQGRSLIDYKTGGTMDRKKVLAGEDVQLLSYAHTIPETRELIYLSIDRSKKISPKVTVNNEELDELVPQLAERLETMLDMLQKKAPLPAWGDQKTCSYCEFSGLCRRESWV